MKQFKSCLLGTVFIILVLLSAVFLTETYQIQSPANKEECFTLGSKKIDFGNIDLKRYSVFVNHKYFNTGVWEAYVDENSNIFISQTLLTEMLDCYVSVQQDARIIIQKNENEVILQPDSKTIISNGAELTLNAVPIQYEGSVYVPIVSVAENLGYSVTWDESQGLLSIISSSLEHLPSAYDYRENNREPVIKDQGSLGTCWAVASLSALESTLLPSESAVFAADHMSIQNSFTNSQNDGGDYTMCMAYLTSWQGPILEVDDPYGDEISPDDIDSVKHVQEIQLIGEKNYEKVKEAIFKYGAVQSSIHLTLTNPYSESIYYNGVESAYCYMGEKEANHEIIIIGWDDTYPAAYFNGNAKEDGAFICQNSWGIEFGENGIFYVSYEDINIGLYNVVYTRVEDTDNYDNIYQTDLCGWVGQMGYNQKNIFFANAYVAAAKEELRAVGFYATIENINYEIYIVKKFEDADSFENKELLQKGSIDNSGYYTIDLKESITLEEGEKYAVIVNVISKSNEATAAVEYAVGNVRNEDLAEGEGYISPEGTIFERTETAYESNVCLKVYTDNISY